MSSLLDLLKAGKVRRAMLKKEKRKKYVREHREIINEQKRMSKQRRKAPRYP